MEKTKKDVLIIGASGLLGRALCAGLSKNFNIAAPLEAELDITDAASTADMCKSINPRVVVLAAAYTDVDGCEDNPKLAHRVNVEGVQNVANVVAEIGAVLIFISTDYIFDGELKGAYTEEDKPNAISVYGSTKQKAEEVIRRSLKEYIIVRSCWLFGEGKKGFIHFVIESIKNKKELRIVSDKTGSPTYVVDLSEAIDELIALVIGGKYDFRENHTVNIVNSGICSWFDMAEFIAGRMNAKDIKLERLKLSEFPFKAKRPKNSALDTSRYTRITGKPLRPWQEALEEFIKCQND